MRSAMEELDQELRRFRRLDKKLKRKGHPRRRSLRLKAGGILLAALLLMIAIPPFRYPVGGRVSSRFFLRQRPEATSPFILDLEVHHGMDIAAAAGSPILASAPGIVTEVGQDAALGTYVRIRHLLGLSTVYGHMSQALVARGQLVLLRSLRPIGLVGSTGRSTGPHVHFALYAGGRAIPPLTFLLWHDIRRLILHR